MPNTNYIIKNRLSDCSTPSRTRIERLEHGPIKQRAQAMSNLQEFISDFIIKKTKVVANEDDKNEKLNQLKKAVLLSIKSIQENINHGGIAYFNDANYYGQITDIDAQEIFRALTSRARPNKKDLVLICRHEKVYGANKDLKWSCWKTNYTNSAQELRNFILTHQAANIASTAAVNDNRENWPNQVNLEDINHNSGNVSYPEVEGKSRNEDDPDMGWFIPVDNNPNNIPDSPTTKGWLFRRLAKTEITTIIHNMFSTFFKLSKPSVLNTWTIPIPASNLGNQDASSSTSDKQLFIEPMVEGKQDLTSELKEILKTSEKYESIGNSLTLIPYGISNRGILRENHAVLVVVYKQEVYLIDPKNTTDPQIGKVFNFKHFSLGWQSTLDITNCGRYTAELAYRLGKEFSAKGNDFSIEGFLAKQKKDKPYINQIALQFEKYLTEGDTIV
jgi:hypothetical protein